MRQIYRGKGFEGEELERVVDLITSDRARWVQTMLTEEYGLPREVRSPWIAALCTFSAFILCGLVPLIPFIFYVTSAFRLSMLLTGVVFFAIGSIKARWSTSAWWQSGLETFLVGSATAGSPMW